ncbi:MAG: permease prefix domain 1-containing protein [Oscillospiraceae bacterium]|nr:permease prefix domain 1-containing protein [Oscillospiraceae bacterium]
MQKDMSDYLDRVCAAIRGNTLRQAARGELADHINERYGELLKEGLAPETAALETVKRMGDPETLGRRISAANRMSFSCRGLVTIGIGLAVAVLILALGFYTIGGELAFFIDLPSLILVGGLSAAYALLHCGKEMSLLRFLGALKTGALYAGVIIWIIGIMTMLHKMQSDPYTVGSIIAVSMISLLYGLLISAAARITEKHLSPPEAGVIRGLIE